MTEKDMPDVIYAYDNGFGLNVRKCDPLNGLHIPYIKRIVTAEAAKAALAALNGPWWEDVEPHEETIRALLLAHAGAE